MRVARIDGKYIINPTFDQLEQADMDIMVAATYENIMMVEGEMNEVSEAELLGSNESGSRSNQSSLQSSNGIDRSGWQNCET